MLGREAISGSTVQRLHQAHGLDRVPLRDDSGNRVRLRCEGGVTPSQVDSSEPDAAPTPVRPGPGPLASSLRSTCY
jgi:hypothetical protein